MSTPNCFLLSSHDDFSVVSMLPPDAAVLTQLRDPLDRFLSAYEFAVEVASRTVKRSKPIRKKIGRIATEDVWPWSYLVPFFADDMKPKVEAAQAVPQPPEGRWVEVEQDGERWFYNKALNESKWNITAEEAALGGGVLPMMDPYDNELVMSLKDFAQHPIATELLHNGATFQVLGITNYSHWGDAGSFRSCLHSSETLRSQLLGVAQARIRRFTHVGTTDRLYESAASALVSMGLTVDSAAYAGSDEDVAGRGGVRRRAAADHSQAGGHGQEQGQEQGRGRGRAGDTAAKVQLLAKLIREARRRLQSSQKELVDAQRAHGDDSLVEMLRNRVDTARNELIEAQEKLAAMRDQLPESMGGLGLGATGSIDDGALGAHAARRRLMQADDSAQQQEQQQVDVESTSGGGGEGVLLSEAAVADTTQDEQQQQHEGSGAADQGSGLDSAAEGTYETKEATENRRRLASRLIVPSLDAFGNQLDPEFKRIANTGVGAEFVRCATRAQQRSSSRRDQSLAALATADGRHVAFSKAARGRIPAEVLDIIRSYNTMDTALHQLGLSLLDTRVTEQKADLLFQELPRGGEGEGSQRAPRKRNTRLVKPRDEGAGDELR